MKKIQNTKFATEKPQTYHFNFFGKSRFPILLYIGPTGEYYSEYEECTVANLRTEQTFKELSEMGVNTICGHNESYEDNIKILEYCKQYLDVMERPREIVFRKELPRTLVGKVAYRVLEEEAAEEENKK